MECCVSCLCVVSYPYHSARNPPISIPPPEVRCSSHTLPLSECLSVCVCVCVQVQQALTKIDLWEFDIIGFEELSHNE